MYSVYYGSGSVDVSDPDPQLCHKGDTLARHTGRRTRGSGAGSPPRPGTGKPLHWNSLSRLFS